MIRPPLLAAATAALLLTACAGTPDPEPVPAVPLTLEETPPQAARPGACHLVLWTRAEPSRRILVAWDRPAEAIAQVSGQTLVLPLASFDGEANNGHYQRQTWKTRTTTISTDVRFESLPGASDVSAIRSAAVSVTDARGETLVVPAIGMVSCGAPPASPPAP